MAEPFGFLAVLDLVKALRAMSTGDGYHFDYAGVLEGFRDWVADTVTDEPTIYVLAEPERQEFGGERAAGGAFQHWMIVHARVHLKAPAGNDSMELCQKMSWAEDDLKKAALTDRHRGSIAGHPTTFFWGATWLWPQSLPEGAIGGTVDAEIRIRWDSSAASNAATT